MSFNEKIAHIVYASDDNFAEILGVSLVSLYENSRDMEDIIIYILESGIKWENKKKLSSIADTYNRTAPIFIRAKDITQELHMDVSIDRGSLSQYARLFVSSNLPAGLDRILYLDCDVIINHSICELWRLDLKGKTIAALIDAFSSYYRVNIDLQPDDIMFNSGVMLIDLNRWEQQQVERKLLEFITKKKGKIQQGDQGALNAVLSHDTYSLDPIFNSITIFYDFTYKEIMIYRKPPRFYSEKQIRNAVEKPVIIHFTTSFLSKRAWMDGCQHKFVNEWLRYKAISPWKDTKLWRDTRPWWKLLCSWIFGQLPRCLAIRIAGILQVYGRPLKNRVKMR